MLRYWVKKLGVGKSVLIITVVGMTVSFGITFTVMNWLYGYAKADGLTISVFVPLLLAPIFSYAPLRLVLKLDAMEEQLRHLAVTDSLTQAFNRRHFLEQAGREFSRAKRTASDELAVVVLDLDDFKRINDSYGHPAGDLVLQRVSDLCREAIRANDIFARYGGEEFVFLLPGMSREAALDFAERVRACLETTAIALPGGDIQVTASFGIVAYDDSMASLDILLTQADQALYRAKVQGKNRLAAIHPVG